MPVSSQHLSSTAHLLSRQELIAQPSGDKDTAMCVLNAPFPGPQQTLLINCSTLSPELTCNLRTRFNTVFQEVTPD